MLHRSIHHALLLASTSLAIGPSRGVQRRSVASAPPRVGGPGQGGVRQAIAAGTGLAAVFGGVIWMGGTAVMASRPAGRPGVYRATDDLVLPMGIALVLMMLGLAGLSLRATGPTGLTGRVALTLAGVGLGLACAGQVIMGSGDERGWQIFAPGALVMVSGTFLYGVVALRAGVLPLGATCALAFGSAALLLFNTEDARAWLGVPFGLAWLWLGIVVWSARTRVPAFDETN